MIRKLIRSAREAIASGRALNAAAGMAATWGVSMLTSQRDELERDIVNLTATRDELTEAIARGVTQAEALQTRGVVMELAMLADELDGFAMIAETAEPELPDLAEALRGARERILRVLAQSAPDREPAPEHGTRADDPSGADRITDRIAAPLDVHRHGPLIVDGDPAAVARRATALQQHPANGQWTADDEPDSDERHEEDAGAPAEDQA